MAYWGGLAQGAFAAVKGARKLETKTEFKFKLYHSLNWVPQASYVNILVTYLS